MRTTLPLAPFVSGERTGSAPQPDSRWKCGGAISHYRIVEQIGAGGMGEVYRARDEHLNREVAIKILRPGTLSDEHSRKQFHKEATALSRLNHPNIATIFDFDTQEDVDFLVMEYIPGASLSDRVSAGPLPEKEVLRLGVQLAEGLSDAHEHGVVHRDLKPSNLRITDDGRLKILDFGLAKLRKPTADAATTETNLDRWAITGTLAYMAPEQVSGEEIDGRTDIHAAGLVLFEMSTGRRPFPEVEISGLLGAILHRLPPPVSTLNPLISPELERIIGKCSQKERKSRYQSSKELAADLGHLERESDSESTPARARGAPPWFPARLNRSVIRWAAVVLLLILIVAGVFLAMRPLANRWPDRSPIPRTKQVAVLPFSVVGGDPATAAFSAGLTETLTAKLTQLTADPGLQVVPAAEIRARHVGTVDDARREFGANLALEGSLHKAGGEIRVNFVLVDAQTLRQIRASSMTVEATDPFHAQDAVVYGALRMLDLKVQGRERQAVESHGTQVARAYDYYLQGIGYLQNYDRVENLDSAIQVFERALGLDPNYASAFAGLGDTYWKKYVSSKDPAWIEKSREGCEQANRLDNQLTAAHVCLGNLLLGTGKYEQAAMEFARAAESEPTSDAAHHGLADAYERLGKPEEAEAAYRRAIALRPHYWAAYNWLGVFFYRHARFRDAVEMFLQVVALAPDSFRGYSNLGACYVEQGRYNEAIGILERSIAIRPSAHGYTNLGNSYYFLRRYEEADSAYEQAVKLAPRDPLVWWNLGDGYSRTPGKRPESARAYRQAIAIAWEDIRVNPQDAQSYGILAICEAMLAEKEPALGALRRGLQIAPDDPFLLFNAGLVYTQLGQPDVAVEWLEKSVAAGYSPSRVRDSPDFEALRSKPQFQALLGPK